jgi:Zn-dependent protease
MDKLTFALLSFSALVPAIMLHEIAHGAAALWCGDTTARDAGRLSLNPLRHVDPFMSVILPAILALSGSRVLFGGAKPVPINLRRCRDPLKAYWITAIAGPLCNLVQAVIGALLFHGLIALARTGFVRPWTSWVLTWLVLYVSTNAVLMVFNLVPVPPLDGSRVVTVLLPPRLRWRYASLDRIGLLLVFGLLYIPAFNETIWRLVSGFLSIVGMDFD